MERRIASIMYALITFALITEMSFNVQAKDNNKRRPKEKTGGFQKNICDITDRDSKVHCYCENTREPRNATKAECWVFNGGIPPDDVIWQSFASQPSLQTLSFNVRVEGALGYVPTKALQYLQKLKSINLKYGNIVEVIPFALANLTNLREVTLTQNQIEILQRYAFAHLPNLTTLNLDENMILDIGSEVFVDVPKLHKLVLAKNNITSIKDGAFQDTFNLFVLDLSRNNIFHLNRHTFDGLANLRVLDLRKNRIYNLTEFTFAELWSLQELSLGKNDLKYISERSFDGLSQLKKLFLDDNKLAFLPSGLFEGVRGLSSLDLRSNELHALTFDNIEPILDNLKPQNSNLLLQDNNFVCDCRLTWMYTFRNETKSQDTRDSLDSITCKMDSPIVSAAYNKISDSKENIVDYHQDILHAGMTIETADKTNVTEKKIIEEFKDDKQNKKTTKRNILKISPDTLPCPKDSIETTEPPFPKTDPLIPFQNIMKTDRYEGFNRSNKSTIPYHCIVFSIIAFYLT